MEAKTRWMKSGDSTEVIRILNASGESMDDKRMDRLVSKSGVVCMVAEVDSRIVGLMAYDISRVSKIKMLLLAVDEVSRRMGVGSSLIELITAKLNKKRKKIELSISEYNLGGQLFLKAMGFRAVSVLDSEDGTSKYMFVYRLEEPATADS